MSGFKNVRDYGKPLKIREADGTPLIENVGEIVVSDGTLTDIGDYGAQIETGGMGVKTISSTNNNIFVNSTDPENVELTWQLTDNQNLLTDDQIAIVDNTSGTNTGDQVLPTRDSLGLDTDDTVTFANLSGTNTGDQDLTGLVHTNRTALDAVSGTNTGDQVGDGITITGTGTVADPFIAALSDLLVYGKNTTGAIITKGTPTSIASANGAWTAFGAVDITTPAAYAFVGLATANIAINAFGWVLKNGVLTGLNTNAFDEGKPVYVSHTGGLTKTYPTVPDYIINVGMCEYKHGTNGRINIIPNIVSRFQDLSDVNGTPLSVTGQIPVWDNTGKYFDFTDNITNYVPKTVLGDTINPTGWLDGDNITVSYNWTNRTITLTGNLDYYWRGVKKTLTSPWTSPAHTATVGTWFLRSMDGNAPVWTQTAWDFTMVMAAYVNYQATEVASFALKETHGIMDFESHEELHSQIGTYRVSGGQLTTGTYTENTASDAATTPGFDSSVIKDEDVTTAIPTWTQGTYTTMYVGAANTSVFNVAATFPFVSTGSYLQVNNTTTGAMPNGVSNRYYNVYQIMMPVTSDTGSQKYRMIMLQPQATYTSLANAQAEDVRGLRLGELASLSPEFNIYARITYVTNNGDGNTGKCRIATGGVTYNIGNRAGQVSVSGFSGNDHAVLSNLEWANAGHTGTVSSFATFDGSGLASTQLLSTKQDTLVSGTGIKTINSSSILASGNLNLSTDIHSNITALNAVTGTNTGDQTSIVGITGTIAQFNAALTDGDFATGGGTATGTNTGDQDLSGKQDLLVSGTNIKTINGTSVLGSGSISTTAPRVSTETSSATPTINTDNVDAHSITALATAITSMTTNLSGTPTNFQKLLIRIKDSGSAQGITWGASFSDGSGQLPTTTVAGETLLVGLMYNSVTSKWECQAPGASSGGGMANPMTTEGDIIYGGTSGAPTRLGKGVNGQVLTMGATNPSWTTPSLIGISTISDFFSAKKSIEQSKLELSSYTYMGGSTSPQPIPFTGATTSAFFATSIANATTDTITINNSGNYRVWFTSTARQPTYGGNVTLNILKNGATVIATKTQVIATSFIAFDVVPVLVDLLAGDVLTMTFAMSNTAHRIEFAGATFFTQLTAAV